MILAKTGAPEYIYATAIGPDPSYLVKYTNLCHAANNFPIEYALAYQYKNALTSADPLNAFRGFTKTFFLVAPQLDVPTISMYVKKLTVLPPEISQNLDTEVSIALNNAINITYNPTLTALADSGAINEDSAFVNQLARAAQTSSSPCNYFKKPGDSLGFHSNTAQVPSQHTSPLWDIMCDFVPAPIGVQVKNFNKVAPVFMQNAMQLKVATEHVFRSSLSAYFTPDRIEQEKKMLKDNKNPHANANSLPYSTDINSFINAGKTGLNILNMIAKQMGDCFRIFDFNKRYNPLDPDMNLTYVKKPRIVTADKSGNGTADVVDINGKQVPQYLLRDSISDLNTPESYIDSLVGTAYGPNTLSNGYIQTPSVVNQGYYAPSTVNAAGYMVSGEGLLTSGGNTVATQH